MAGAHVTENGLGILAPTSAVNISRYSESVRFVARLARVYNRRNRRVQLVPPKPKELVRAISTFISRALLGT